MRLILAAVMLAATAVPAAAQQTSEHDGEPRRYYLELPRGARPAPAIVVLHGGVTVPSRMRRVTHFTLHEEGWAEVYPVALGDRWGAGDLAFLEALIERLSAEGLIDPARVFFAGASDGGALVLRLVCEAPGLVAGAAVVSMSLPEGPDCAGGPPVPLMLFNGTADPVVPFAGGDVPGIGRVLPARETAARLARRNGCGAFDEIAITDHYPGDGTRATLHAYRGCSAAFRHYVIEGGGHTWPGNRVSRWVEQRLGTTSRDISASFEIEAFFTGPAAR